MFNLGASMAPVSGERTQPADRPAVSETIARLDIDFLDYHIARVGRGGRARSEGMGANVFVG